MDNNFKENYPIKEEEKQNTISMTGKKADEIMSYLLSGEADDLSFDFTKYL